MATAAPAPLIAKNSAPCSVLMLGLHVFVVYMLAIHVSPVLVGRWFAWVLPLFQFHTSVAPRDWYLQHLELATILPALIAGYINVARFIPTIVGGQLRDVRNEPGAVWAWVVPTIVLAGKIVQYHMLAPESVLHAGWQSSFQYFFEVEQHMPTLNDMVRGDFKADPVRLVAQLFVTAPFYAGITYSLGALASKRQLISKLFVPVPDEPDAPLLPDGILGGSTSVPPSPEN